MAIVDHPGFPCWNRRHQLAPPPVAVAVVRRTNSPDAPLEPRCRPCVLKLIGSDGHYVVAYLDPTRQRRPQPNLDDGAWIDGVWYDRASFYRKYGHPAGADPA